MGALPVVKVLVSLQDDVARAVFSGTVAALEVIELGNVDAPVLG
jgi:hypothetical protein